MLQLVLPTNTVGRASSDNLDRALEFSFKANKVVPILGQVGGGKVAAARETLKVFRAGVYGK